MSNPVDPYRGQPQFGQPPQYGQPQYGQPQYGHPLYGQPQYGQPRYGYPMPGYGQRSAAASGVTAIVSSVLAILGALPASAHASLVRSSPESGATLTAAPPEVALTFNEEINQSFASVAVTAGDDRTNRVTGEPMIDGETVTARVDAYLDRRLREEGPGSLEGATVVLDPPRSGAGEQVVRQVAAAEPERVIHVGCDPATFARDLGYWAAQGFSARRMVLIDAFPNTHHFEIIALLEPSVPLDR